MKLTRYKAPAIHNTLEKKRYMFENGLFIYTFRWHLLGAYCSTVFPKVYRGLVAKSGLNTTI